MIVRIYIYIILFLALVLNWIVRGNDMERELMNLNLLPKAFIIIIEFFQTCILIYIIARYGKLRFIKISTFAISIFLFFELLLHLTQGNNLLIYLAGIRYYFSFFPLFLLSYILGRSGYLINREFYFLLFLCTIQIPIAIWQFFKLDSIVYIGTKFDLVTGTMGGLATNLLSLVISILLFYTLVKYFETKKILYIFFSGVCIIPSALSEAKGMFILLFILLIYISSSFKLKFSNIFSLVVILIVLVSGFIFFYSLLGYGDRRNLLDMSFLLNVESTDNFSLADSQRMSRVQSIKNASEAVFNDQSPLFGFGIGSASNNPFGDSGKYYSFFTIRHNIDRLITEIGFLGLFLFFTLLFQLIIISSRVLNLAKNANNPFNVLASRMSIGLVLILSFGMFWTDVLFRVQFMYPFGFIAGYVRGTYDMYIQNKINKQNQNNSNYL